MLRWTGINKKRIPRTADSASRSGRRRQIYTHPVQPPRLSNVFHHSAKPALCYSIRRFQQGVTTTTIHHHQLPAVTLVLRSFFGEDAHVVTKQEADTHVWYVAEETRTSKKQKNSIDINGKRDKRIVQSIVVVYRCNTCRLPARYCCLRKWQNKPERYNTRNNNKKHTHYFILLVDDRYTT